MIARPRTLGLIAAAVTLLPAIAQGHWVDSCRCERATIHSYYHHNHHRHVAERYVAVQLAPNTFAIPYRLRNYPYVNCIDDCGDRYVDRAVTVREPAVMIEDRTRRDSSQSRTIKADAEVTILGPDRMNIRLFRKGRGKTVNPDE